MTQVRDAVEEADAVELATAIRQGRLSATGLAQLCLARYEALEPMIRAFVTVDAGRLLRAAAATDEGIARGRRGGALAGVPFAVKDVLDTADLPTEYGSEVFRGRRPERSAEAVLALLSAGGLLFGKSVTAELAHRQPGPTGNPWNLAHTPGGSSMGSAAAVAARIVPAAIGTQTNGSVIRPAAYCGIVGFKPSRGRISTAGVLRFSPTLDHVGAFATSVTAAGLLVDVMARRPRESGTARRGRRRADPAPPRVAVVRTQTWGRAEPSMRRCFDDAVAALARSGAEVVEPVLPAVLADLEGTHRTIMAVEGGESFRAYVEPFPERFSAATRALVEEGSRIPRSEYLAALDRRARAIPLFARWVAGHEAVVTLATLGEAPDTTTTGDATCCTLWTLLGAPAVTVPAARGPQGLPLGIQLVGAPGGDAALLVAARWCEAVLGFSDLPPVLAGA